MATFISYVEPYINAYGVRYKDLPPVLTAYHKVLTTDKLNVFIKMSYIPILSNLKGLVVLVAGAVIAPLALIATLALLSISAMPLAMLSALYSYVGAMLFTRGVIQQIPVIGNTILAKYDAAALMRGGN